MSYVFQSSAAELLNSLSDIENALSMGFDRVKTAAALLASSGDMESAISNLLSDSSSFSAHIEDEFHEYLNKNFLVDEILPLVRTCSAYSFTSSNVYIISYHIAASFFPLILSPFPSLNESVSLENGRTEI